MAKLKTPLLGFEAHGSIGGSLTYQGRGKTAIVRSKPVLPYFLTLPSQYQRWLYQDYALLWTLQTTATKQIYASTGVRFHLTGFQYWMKYHLKKLPDILGYWRLDDTFGATTPDSSRNGNTATIIGASPIGGVIDKALYFDALNNRLECGNDPSLVVTGDFSLETFIYLYDVLVDYAIADRNAINNFYWRIDGVGKQNLYVKLNDDSYEQKLSNTELTAGVWHHIVANWHNATKTIEFMLDGEPDGGGVLTLPLRTTGWQPLYLGAYNITLQDLKGNLDQFIYRNRTLHASEAKLHSTRRWPS